VTATLPAPPVAPGQTDFDQIAHEYDDSLPGHVVAHYLAKRLAFIRQHAPPVAGPTLDVGCGTGLLAERVAAAGYAVVAVDPFRGMLAQFHRRRPAFPVAQAGGEALPFPDCTFALVYCIAVMHHVADPLAVRRTLLEMARVTKPGGRILVWDHNPLNPYWPLLMRRVPQDTGAERLIPAGEIVAGLRAGGACILQTAQLGLVPDFTPSPLLPAAALAERLVERTPGLRRLCAHNVVLAEKT
jgi:SAM-dependent methyltransferase